MSKVTCKVDLTGAEYVHHLPSCFFKIVPMEKRMMQFLAGQKVAAICCVDEENNPYCFSCFYAFDEEKKLIYFKTSPTSHHAVLMHGNATVAGTIQPDKLNPLAIKGIQFSGRFLKPGDECCENAVSNYHNKYPFAAAMQGVVYTIQLHAVKMTDNTLGFGKKITWKRDERNELAADHR